MIHTKTIAHPHRVHPLSAKATRHAPPRSVSRPLAEGFNWSASGWAGLAAGAAFILIQTSFVSLFSGDSSTDAIRQIAAIAVGESRLPPPNRSTALIFLPAMGVHMILSLIYARILAAIVHGMRAARAISIGAAFGVLLYTINYYLFTDIFPWFAVSRGWITLTAHVAFGVIAAGVYGWLTLPSRRPPVV